MPTYRVREVTGTNVIPGKVFCTVECEQCCESLGLVHTRADLQRLSAGAVLGLWPEMAGAIRAHEATCRGG
jgi:hypothetical protein